MELIKESSGCAAPPWGDGQTCVVGNLQKNG